MAIRRIANRLYTAGLYGPFTLTGVAKTAANSVKITLTQPAAWPDVPAALRIRFGFTLNGVPSYEGGGVLPGGWMQRRDGTLGTGDFTMGSNTVPEFDSAFLEFEAYVDLEVAFTIESVMRDMHQTAVRTAKV